MSLYSGKTNTLIATVDEQGKLHFMPEYIESLKQIDEGLTQMLHLEDLDFQLLEELEKEDKVLTREERIHLSSQKMKNNKKKGKTKGEKQNKRIRKRRTRKISRRRTKTANSKSKKSPKS